jgi:hypothetical protein
MNAANAVDKKRKRDMWTNQRRIQRDKHSIQRDKHSRPNGQTQRDDNSAKQPQQLTLFQTGMKAISKQCSADDAMADGEDDIEDVEDGDNSDAAGKADTSPPPSTPSSASPAILHNDVTNRFEITIDNQTAFVQYAVESDGSQDR